MTDFLIVDDDPTLLDVLARALTRRGYSVVTAQEATQAMELFETHIPQHVCLDLKLEHGSTLDLIETMKQIHPSCKIVMLTAYASIATAVDAVKKGAIQYLCKPVDIEQILGAFAEEAGPADIKETPTNPRRLEWEHIQQVLHKNQGNISVTARELGMHRRTLQRKLQKRPVKE